MFASPAGEPGYHTACCWCLHGTSSPSPMVVIGMYAGPQVAGRRMYKSGLPLASQVPGPPWAIPGSTTGWRRARHNIRIQSDTGQNHEQYFRHYGFPGPGPLPWYDQNMHGSGAPTHGCNLFTIPAVHRTFCPPRLQSVLKRPSSPMSRFGTRTFLDPMS